MHFRRPASDLGERASTSQDTVTESIDGNT